MWQMKSFFKETPLNSFSWNYYQRWRIVLARAVFNIAACTLRSMMIIIPTSSICDLFQTSSKKACEKHPQWTGQPHLAKGFISGRNFHNIRRKLDKKRFNSDYSYKRMWTKQQQQTGKFKLTRQRASSARETVTISEENCIQKNYGLC